MAAPSKPPQEKSLADDESVDLLEALEYQHRSVHTPITEVEYANIQDLENPADNLSTPNTPNEQAQTGGGSAGESGYGKIELEMTELTRPEIDAKLELIESRMDARVKSIEEKIDGFLEIQKERDKRIDVQFESVSSKIDDTNRAVASAKNTTIAVGISSVLAIAGLVIGIFAITQSHISVIIDAFSAGLTATLEQKAAPTQAPIPSDVIDAPTSEPKKP